MKHSPAVVLVGTDFSPEAERAEGRAAELALRHGAAIRLVHSTGEGDWLQRLVDHSHGAFDRELARRLAEDRLAASRDRLLAAGLVDVEAEVCSEPLGRCLGELVEHTGASMLVIGAHGAGGMRDAMLGSTADRLLRKALLPVLVVRRDPGGTYRNVALATDFSAAAREAAGWGLALTPGARHYLLHASQLPPDRDLAMANLSEESLMAFRRAADTRSADALEEFAHGLGRAGRSAVRAPRTGSRTQVLADFVAESDIDLVVLGTRPRARWEANLLGSVARYAVSGLDCDVLLVPATEA